jgi:hypothetical protein
MYKVIVSDKNYDTVADYTGCVQLRISDSGTISAEFYDGSQTVYRMLGGDSVDKQPLTEEEVYATPGLGDWYKAQVEKQELESKLKKGADTPAPMN